MNFSPETPFDLPQLPPDPIPKGADFIDSLLAARVALAELKGYSHVVPNPLLLLSPAILRESVASSEIENIHTTLIDVLENDLFPETERRESDKEVLRYRDSILLGFGMLPDVPLCSRMVAAVHETLLPHLHGEYRRVQNTIANTATGDTLYTPPVCTELGGLVSNWERFINSGEGGPDPLIKAAIAHYQFEAMHPFVDGNGRCGRILMVLQLIQDGLLEWPILYISGYINERRADYYSCLRGVTARGDWHAFIRFMLDGFAAQAVATHAMLRSVMELHEKWRHRIQRDHPRIYSYELVQALFAQPITTPVQLGRLLGIHYTTASRYLKQLAAAGLLTEKAHGKYRLFMNAKLLDAIRT